MAKSLSPAARLYQEAFTQAAREAAARAELAGVEPTGLKAPKSPATKPKAVRVIGIVVIGRNGGFVLRGAEGPSSKVYASRAEAERAAKLMKAGTKGRKRSSVRRPIRA
jgi:hypothetical protein